MAAFALRAESAPRNPSPFPSRAAIEAKIEALIELLDQLDGDVDAEDGDEDCCPAHDDRIEGHVDGWFHSSGAGDADDAEEDEGEPALMVDQREPEVWGWRNG